ncbi:hypothetical protein KDW39_08820 [Burkholderia multivorans]|uniref:hypothetical protein n=1 Tax=Burkholderia multivorans TaxID=87883 RepID=UPI001B9235F1|nr:hypothetical protein [Burkholderia multivorans]MBR8123250.1 hypothetical protein [Burkholderia multivorans]MBU9600311.1 hypothetical protein [Burkholderia multivorans]
MEFNQLLAGLEAKPTLGTDLVAEDLADRSLRNPDVLGDGSLSPVGVQQVADE